MNKVLVTGSQGYIGSVLLPKLIERNYDITAFDTGFFDDGELYKSDKINFIKKDMRNFDYKLLDGVDSVVHLASIANDPFGKLSPERIYDPITNYSFSLALECKKRNINFIWPSSCSVYGISDGFLDENSPLNPQTPYSSNKVDFEEKLKELCDKNFTPIVLRLCTLYGLSPRIRFDLVINMFAGMAFSKKEIILNSDGSSWRPVVHIEDVSEVILQCLEGNILLEQHKDKTKPLILNVGSNSENYRIHDLAQLASKLIKGCKVSFLNHKENIENESHFKDQNVKGGVDKRTYRVSFDKLSLFLPDFKINFSAEDGIRQMIDKFNDIGLTYENFINYKYYRLKTMDYLLENKFIDENLMWR